MNELLNRKIASFRQDFPNLKRRVHDKPLIYMDNAATTLKTQGVIDAVERHYSQETANVHRGVHFLSEYSTSLFEGTRESVRKFLNAELEEEIIFTSGTTASINLVAQSFGQSIKEGDEIIISWLEHHSNIVPWQMLCERTGAVLKVIPVDDDGALIMEEYDRLLSEKTAFVSCVWVSNTLGTVNPIKEIIEKAHVVGAKVLVDAAQAVCHMPVDVRDIDCDFLAFSGHKLLGPTGTGVLYGKKDLLDAMPPVNGGGDMIDTVTFEKTTYADLPNKFEPGTPNIAGFIGLGKAVDYLLNVKFDDIIAIENALTEYGTEKLQTVPGLKIIGTAPGKASVLSFVIDGIHPHDIGTFLDQDGVAVRTGHHCTQPIMQRFNIPATARASLAFYNTFEEIDILTESLIKTVEIFA